MRCHRCSQPRDSEEHSCQRCCLGCSTGSLLPRMYLLYSHSIVPLWICLPIGSSLSNQDMSGSVCFQDWRQEVWSRSPFLVPSRSAYQSINPISSQDLFTGIVCSADCSTFVHLVLDLNRDLHSSSHTETLGHGWICQMQLPSFALNAADGLAGVALYRRPL